MKVYIVEGGWLYDGFEVIGVFSNKEDAERVKQNNEQYEFAYDYVDIEEFEVR